MKVNVEISESARRQTALLLAGVAWGASFLLVLLDVTRAVPNFQGLGTMVILLVGVAVAASQYLIWRYVEATITGVFTVGMRARDLTDGDEKRNP